MSILQATVRARGATPLSVTPFGNDTLFTNSPPSAGPATRTLTSSASVASGGTGSYSWTRISGSTSIAAASPSSASTQFTGTDVPVNGTISAVFRCTSGAETVDTTVTFTYDSGL